MRTVEFHEKQSYLLVWYKEKEINMKNRWLMLSLLMVVLTAPLFSQELILTETDMELFIETFPLITKDLEALDMEMEQQENSLMLPEAIILSANPISVSPGSGLKCTGR